MPPRIHADTPARTRAYRERNAARILHCMVTPEAADVLKGIASDKRGAVVSAALLALAGSAAIAKATGETS